MYESGHSGSQGAQVVCFPMTLIGLKLSEARVKAFAFEDGECALGGCFLSPFERSACKRRIAGFK